MILSPRASRPSHLHKGTGRERATSSGACLCGGAIPPRHRPIYAQPPQARAPTLFSSFSPGRAPLTLPLGLGSISVPCHQLRRRASYILAPPPGGTPVGSSGRGRTGFVGIVDDYRNKTGWAATYDELDAVLGGGLLYSMHAHVCTGVAPPVPSLPTYSGGRAGHVCLPGLVHIRYVDRDAQDRHQPDLSQYPLSPRPVKVVCLPGLPVIDPTSCPAKADRQTE
ncbi:hypothetical protein MAPG_05179 [Magnaporthiopsis poae ATCC 64411]|uniref:Uncharacterized protein n=1 Tax=Magnaporthiopsis poae (strain ATCC 64411 / 73-15) TaxID=644358 RepID=A0A0C4DYQ3_MAGP6|nr:hypothetical protein MAPG_05179 [Magnaporthiopsis poae ATCC 64411]